MTRLFGLTVSLWLTLLIVSAEVACGEDPVVFGSPQLKGAVEATLGVHDPTPTDMLRLMNLRVGRRISDLTGLEHARNLQHLDLEDNLDISDVSPLAELTRLESLDLSRSQISDISPLAGLTNLQDLDLGPSQISDISPLAGLTNLQRLDLAGNQISDISSLAGLTNVVLLRLDRNRISDISSLAGLTELQRLWLFGNPLDCAAYCEFIPTIVQNNPGLSRGTPLPLNYDPMPESCECPVPQFVRGDSNSNAEVNLTDAVYSLDWLFREGPPPSCQDTADANDDGRLNIADPVYTLLFLFRRGSPLPPPGIEACGGPDLTEDELTCSFYPGCEE